MVLARRTRSEIALHTRCANKVVDRKTVAFVKIAVLDNLINGGTTLVAELRDSKKFRVGAQLLDGDTVDVVPRLTLATGTTLFKYA